MRFKNIHTFESLLKEYGMKSGSSTPSGEQQTGAVAKQTAATKSVKSPTTQKQTPKKDLGSPTTTPNLDKEQEIPQFINVKASELEKDTEYFDKDGKSVGVIASPIGDGSKPDAIVVQDPKSKKYSVLDDPDQEVFVANPEMAESKLGQMSKSSTSDFSFKKNKLHKKIKKLTRKIKLREQGEPLFEINFNSKELATSALKAPIMCGFEAETTWPDVQGGFEDDDGDWMEGMTWSEVSDLVYDQEGSRSVDMIEQNYREWLMETDYFYDAEHDVIRELVVDRKEDEYYLNDYVRGHVDESDIEDYRDTILAELESEKDEGNEDAATELEEREDWDIDAWGREYVEENEQDGFEEWLADEIRDNGEHWDDAWERAMEACDIDQYMYDEHGSWYDLLRREDIFLYNENGGGGRDEIASRIEDWASNNSQSNDVRAGDYHSGLGVDNSYWRVEDDSSIEGEGTGAEIISPVYDSPADMLREMKSLFEFFKTEGVVSNESTGLHITMSMADAAGETNKLKMALLLGDKYVAKQFNRENNYYSKSQLQNIQDYMNDVKQDINNEKSLSALESIISKGVNPGKFSSINFKDATNSEGNDLIEFRVAGGSNYHTMIDTIMKTVIRYAAVMQAGHDPEAYKRDYVKALFKLIKGQDDITTDAQRQAQQVVDPDSINDKVLDAFQKIASKKHYTDTIEALSNAYKQLAAVNKIRNADPQAELDFGEAEEIDAEDWRRQMKTAQKYFIRAFSMLASSVASGTNRAKPQAAQISALRGAVKEFGLTTTSLWAELQQSEFTKNFPGEHHSKLEKMASAVNTLLKKQDAKAPEAAYTIAVPPGHNVYLPEPKFKLLFKDIFNDDETDPNATVSKEEFKVINYDEIEKVKRYRYEMDNNNRYIEQEEETIESIKQGLKVAEPEKVESLKDAIRQRQERVAEWEAENYEYKIDIDAFIKKHGFAPATVRYGSEPIGTPYRQVQDDHRKELSQRFNIKFDVGTVNNTDDQDRAQRDRIRMMGRESVFDKFDKLPVLEQLSLLEKISKQKIDEAWSKKYKDSINCSNPKGFSQKAHCAGKKKKVSERPLTKGEERDKEKYVKGMKKNKGDFEKRYGKDAKAVMYATATKMAKESVNDFNRVKTINSILADHFPVSDLKKQMKAYEAIPMPEMLDAFRDLRGQYGDDIDARSVVRFFTQTLEPQIQEKLNLHEWSKSHIKSLLEAKGLMGRVAGDQFKNGDDTLEFQNVEVYPQDREQFDDPAERDSFVADIEQQLNTQIQWTNTPNNGSLAFGIVTLTDPAMDDKPTYWGRYFKQKRADMMGAWANNQVPSGWKLQKAGAQKLDIGIDPQHLIKSENLHKSVDEIIATVSANSQGHAIQQELLNGLQSIKSQEHPVFEGQIKNLPALRDYFGEIMGPVALMSGMVGGQAEDARQDLMGGAEWATYGVFWPQAMNYALVDSVFIGPDGTEVGISSKGGKGARASAKNIADAIAKAPPELVNKHAVTVKVINTVQEASAIDGPFRLAEMYNLLPRGLEAEIKKYAKAGKADYEGLSKGAKELFNYGTPRQDVPGFNTGYALVALLAKKVAAKINEDPSFSDGCIAFLNQSSIVQLYCKMGKIGDSARVTGWDAVYPPNFQGRVVLDGSKNYYSSRIGGKFAFGFV